MFASPDWTENVTSDTRLHPDKNTTTLITNIHNSCVLNDTLNCISCTLRPLTTYALLETRVSSTSTNEHKRGKFWFQRIYLQHSFRTQFSTCLLFCFVFLHIEIWTCSTYRIYTYDLYNSEILKEKNIFFKKL